MSRKELKRAIDGFLGESATLEESVFERTVTVNKRALEDAIVSAFNRHMSEGTFSQSGHMTRNAKRIKKTFDDMMKKESIESAGAGREVIDPSRRNLNAVYNSVSQRAGDVTIVDKASSGGAREAAQLGEEGDTVYGLSCMYGIKEMGDYALVILGIALEAFMVAGPGDADPYEGGGMVYVYGPEG